MRNPSLVVGSNSLYYFREICLGFKSPSRFPWCLKSRKRTRSPRPYKTHLNSQLFSSSQSTGLLTVLKTYIVYLLPWPSLKLHPWSSTTEIYLSFKFRFRFSDTSTMKTFCSRSNILLSPTNTHNYGLGFPYISCLDFMSHPTRAICIPRLSLLSLDYEGIKNSHIFKSQP